MLLKIIIIVVLCFILSANVGKSIFKKIENVFSYKPLVAMPSQSGLLSTLKMTQSLPCSRVELEQKSAMAGNNNTTVQGHF
jgi:hypothetical protein